MSDDLSLSPQDLIREHKGQPYVDGASDTVIPVVLLLDEAERKRLVSMLWDALAFDNRPESAQLAAFVAMEIAKAERKAAVKS